MYAEDDQPLRAPAISYGTFLGATYASLFPSGYRALALDGALDADRYINNPLESLREQTSGNERALPGRLRR